MPSTVEDYKDEQRHGCDASTKGRKENILFSSPSDDTINQSFAFPQPSLSSSSSVKLENKVVSHISMIKAAATR